MRYARGPEWLSWADGQPAFDRMFEGFPDDNTSGILARWFAQHFTCEHPDEALGIVGRRGSRLSPVLWEEVAFGIAGKLREDDRPDPQTVARWVTVLLGAPPHPGDPSESLAYLLEGCRLPEDAPTAVLLFEHLTQPRPTLGCNERTALKWIGRFNRHGVAGLEEVLRSGRPRVYGPEDVGAVIQAALTPPQEIGLPFASWTLDRLVAYLSEEKDVGMGRTRVAEVLVAEGLRWRKQEGWFGERVDPEFAPKRGPSSAYTHPLQATR